MKYDYYAYDRVQKMTEGKPERYRQMVHDLIFKADGYAGKAGGAIVSRQVIALAMAMVDQIYVEYKEKS